MITLVATRQGKVTPQIDRFAPFFDKTPHFSIKRTATPATVVLRMIYGGIVEEILVRWCLLALLAWVLLKIGIRRPPAIGIAIVTSALLFGALHLPATYHLFGDPPLVMEIRVVAFNAVVGIAFGSAFARSSLEAAMICHAATHLGLLLSSTTAL